MSQGFRIQITGCCLRAIFLASSLCLVACGSQETDQDFNYRTGSSRQLDESQKYNLANGCYQIKFGESYLALDQSSAQYTLQPNQQNATPFFLKPSGLGRYLLMDNGELMLAAHENPVRTSQLDMRLEWELSNADINAFFMQSTQTQQWLGQQGSALALYDSLNSAQTVQFIPAQGCADFPETTTNSEGEPSKGEFEDGAVWGIADVHAHLFGTLAFGGNVMVGDTFHPLGIKKALEDCSNQHGMGGRADITGYATSSVAGYGEEFNRISELPFKLLFGQPLHNTAGYPDFTEWPNSNTTTHELAYYKWLERAYKGGLRLMVNQLVESGPLCKVGRQLSKSYAPTDPNYEFDENIVCNGAATSERQLQATHDLIDYIDAQQGGPGKGWLRLVSTPEEARNVIKQKKMAMIIGSETPDLFGCIDGVEGGRSQCTQQHIKEQLDDYVAKGIRSIFPIHQYDNDFGGALIFNPIIEAAKVIQDGALFHYEGCDTNDYKPLLAIQLPSLYYMLFPKFMKDLPLFPFVPEADGYCNRAGLTDLGEYLILEMMKRGLMIETAHMSHKMKLAVTQIAEYYNYPLVDSHMEKAFDDAAKVEEARYLALGGIRAPLPNRRITVDQYKTVSKSCRSHTSQDLAIQLMAYSDTRAELGLDHGVVFATDVHGMVQTTKPRFGAAAQCDQMQFNPVEYPFTSFDGSVTFNQQVTGNRAFDFNTDGMAHLGLIPDLIQDMRNQGMSDEYVESFFRGAESYLQTWEKSLSRAEEIRRILD